MKKNTALAALLGLLVSGGAYAAGPDAVSGYGEIDMSTFKIEVLDAGAPVPKAGPIMPGADDAGGGDIFGDGGTGIGDIVDSLADIVNVADQVWSIIEKNKPVVDISVTYANAVPHGTTHWTQLQGWSKPAVRRYSLSAKDMRGNKALDVVYQVHWTYGGNFQGKGKFLTGVTVEPLSVSVPWLHKLNMKAHVPDSTVTNVGTSEDPVAAMQVQLEWTVSSLFSANSRKVIYYVQGDGLLEEIGAPFTRGAEAKSDREVAELREKMDNVKF